jgi:hypothetical protein
MSGASFGKRIVSAAFSVAVIRMVPAGFSRSSLTTESAASISSIWGADAVKQTFAGFRRRDAPRRASQEPNAEPLLKTAHSVAQC